MDKLVKLGLGGEVGPAGYCGGEGALPSRASHTDGGAKRDGRWRDPGFLRRPLLGLQDRREKSNLGPSMGPKRWFAPPTWTPY